MLLGDDIYDIVDYCHQRNLAVRIVTNAFWARTFKEAYAILRQLKSLGLTEINISTGDEHLHWVSYDKIVNALVAAHYLEMPTVVNVEASDTKKYNSDMFLKDPRLKSREIGISDAVEFINGKWVYFRKDVVTQKPDTPQQVQTLIRQHANKARCTSLFRGINISPKGHMLACCGLTVQGQDFLDLGDIDAGNIKSTYERNFQDFLKIWLFTEGPYDVLDFCYSKRKDKDIAVTKGMHICEICRLILHDNTNIDILRSSYMEKYPSVILNYTIIKKRIEKLTQKYIYNDKN